MSLLNALPSSFVRLHVLENLVIALVQLRDEDVQQQDAHRSHEGRHGDHHGHILVEVPVVFRREPRL